MLYPLSYGGEQTNYSRCQSASQGAIRWLYGPAQGLAVGVAVAL